jgi:hypothetical protein
MHDARQRSRIHSQCIDLNKKFLLLTKHAFHQAASAVTTTRLCGFEHANVFQGSDFASIAIALAALVAITLGVATIAQKGQRRHMEGASKANGSTFDHNVVFDVSWGT